MPQGHTHLVRSAIKLVPPTKALPIAKIKEVMFVFLLEVLNESAPRADFFKARKAVKPRKRTHRRKGKGDQSADMASVLRSSLLDCKFNWNWTGLD